MGYSILNQIVGGLDGEHENSCVWLSLCPYTPYINLLAWTYDGIFVIVCSDVLFVCHFECLIFDQPHYNPHSTQKNTQMECIWVPHATKCIHCHLSAHLTLQITSKIDFNRIANCIRPFLLTSVLCLKKTSVNIDIKICLKIFLEFLNQKWE